MTIRSAIIAGTAAVLIAAHPASAQSPFDGTWTIRLESIARPPQVDAVTIAGGRYDCSSCTPPVAVRADGAFHAVAGHGEYDETAVRIVDAGTIVRTNRLKGRVVRVETRTLAPDGAGAAMRFTDTINAGVAPVSGEQSLKRLAPGPAGAHALSGRWSVATASQVSDNALTQTLKVDGDMLTLATGEGFSYVAKLDGTPAPARGDPVVDTVSVRRVGEREIAEVDSAKGVPIARFTMTVSPDGRTLAITSRNEASGKVTTMVADRSGPSR